MRLINRTGDRYHRLIVLERAPNAENSNDTNARWLCKCDCGNMIIAYGNDLKREKVKSCGCYNAERIVKHGKSYSRSYNIWKSMLQRCLNENSQSFDNYGGRGIGVSEEWKNFEAFFSDMGNPAKGYSLERKDNSAGYSKENCVWATLKEQLNNRRCNRVIELNGKSQTLTQWANDLGTNFSTLRQRFRLNWPLEKALTQPIKKRSKKLQKKEA